MLGTGERKKNLDYMGTMFSAYFRFHNPKHALSTKSKKKIKNEKFPINIKNDANTIKKNR